MNIAFVNATKGWGGVKTWYLQFAERLTQRGNGVCVYGRQPEFVEAARERVGHAEQVRFGADLNPAAITFFMREFRRRNVEAVIVNIGKDLATAGVAARVLGLPVVQRIGLPGDISPRLKTRLLHAWIRPAFLCPCRFIAEGFVKELPYVRPKDVHVILNGKKAATEPLESHSPRRLICTQQLNPDKGHDVLLRAAAQLSEPFELHMWGKGRAEASLKALADGLGLGQRVFWHGFSFNIMEALRQGDIFLLASLSEGLPNTLLEAMAAGLLPVCRDVGGVREVIPDDLRAWLLPYEADKAAFAEALRRALILPDAELLALRERARQACREDFDIDRQAERLEGWLQSLVEGEKTCFRS